MINVIFPHGLLSNLAPLPIQIKFTYKIEKLPSHSPSFRALENLVAKCKIKNKCINRQITRAMISKEIQIKKYFMENRMPKLRFLCRSEN